MCSSRVEAGRPSTDALITQFFDIAAVPEDVLGGDGWEPREQDDWMLEPPTFGEEGVDPYIGENPPAEGVWPPKGLLADIEPGLLLAAMLDEADLRDRVACPDELVVEVAAAAARLQSWASAIELAATAELSDRVLGWRGVAENPDKHHVSAEQMCASELGCALNLSPSSAMNRVHLAADLRRLPVTRAALGAGVIDLPKARTTVEVLRPLSDEEAAAVETSVIDRERVRVRDGKGRVHSQLQQALRRAAIRVNPAAYEKQERDAFDQRRLEQYPLGGGNPGMAGIGVTHRAEIIAGATDYVRALARAAMAADLPGEERTLDQACADVAMDLLRGRTATAQCSSGGSGPAVHVVVGLDTLLERDDEPGWLAGHGPISAPTARRIAADPSGTWRRLLTDPRTGRMDELSVHTYPIPADMDRHVKARDLTCRWPGCTRPARRCDTDHRIPWPAGATEAGNLQSLCRTHHRMKTHAPTTMRLDDDTGETVTTLPSGHLYRRSPERPLRDDDEQPQDEPDPPGPAHDVPPF